MVDFEKEFQRERQYSANLLRALQRREERLNDLDPGWYAVWREGWEGPYKERQIALQMAKYYAVEGISAVAVYVDTRFAPEERHE